MTKQKRAAVVPALSNERALPNDRESLGLLLRTCERVIEYVNEVGCREKRRHKACAAAMSHGATSDVIDAWMQAVESSAQNQMAKPRPPTDAIAPYVGSQFDTLMAELQHMDLPWFDWENPQSASAIADVQKHERIVAILQGLLTRLHELQGEVATKLEAGCDTFYDIPSRAYKIPTDDPDLLKLVIEDRKPCNQYRTQIDIALEVMKGNEGDARSLLRKAHRKKLLQPRRRKQRQTARLTV